MSDAIQTRREIGKKRARVAFLKEFIYDNQMPAFHNVEAGFFTAAGEKFREMAKNAAEIVKLEEELQQLAFDLERITAEQTELTLAAG